MTGETTAVEFESGPPLAGNTTPEASDPGLVAASAVTLGASIVGLLVALVRSKLLAILLGPSGVSVLANIVTFNSLAVVVANSFTGSGATKAITEARTAGRHHDVRWLVRYTLVAPLAIGVVACVVVALNAAWLSNLLTGTEDHAELLVLAALFVPILGLSNGVAQVLQAFLKVVRIAAGGIVGVVATLVATASLAVVFGLPGAVAAIGVGAAARVLYLLLKEGWVLASVRQRSEPGYARPRLSPILKLSASGTILGLSAAAVALFIRASIVSILGLEQNGIYQPVYEISDVYLVVLLTSTGVYLFAKVTELAARGDRVATEQALGHGLRLLMVLTVPVALISIGFGDFVIRLLYSESFTEASGPLAIQMVGNMFKVVAWSLGAVLLPLGMYRSWLFIGLAMLAIHSLGVVFLAPLLGLDGVALAYVIAWVWSALSTAFVVRFVARLWPSRRDWAVTGVGAGIVATAFVAAALAPEAAALVASATLIAWLVLNRSDLFELISEIVGKTGLLRNRGRGE